MILEHFQFVVREMAFAVQPVVIEESHPDVVDDGSQPSVLDFDRSERKEPCEGVDALEPRDRSKTL